MGLEDSSGTSVIDSRQEIKKYNINFRRSSQSEFPYLPSESQRKKSPSNLSYSSITHNYWI